MRFEVSELPYTTWVEVDLSAIKQNVRTLLQISGVPLMVIVKANGHGHGTIEVSRAALAAGATWLGVARVAEGLDLLEAGIKAPILVLGPTTPQEVDKAIVHGLSLTLHNFEAGEVCIRRSSALGRSLSVHLKIDTGMHRLGIVPEEALALAQQIAEAKGAHLEGVFTHLARADEPDSAHTSVQLARFHAALDNLRQAGIRPKWIHAANTAATLSEPEAHFNMVRVGAAVYGLPPSSRMRLPSHFRPALSWKAQLASCKILRGRVGVGYGHEYVTSKREAIGVLPVGYADGWRRVSNNVALLDGRRVPVVGLVCMDLCMVRLPYAVPIGTEVVLIGRQGKGAIRVDEVAHRWRTSSLDVVCGINARVPRVYINSHQVK